MIKIYYTNEERDFIGYENFKEFQKDTDKTYGINEFILRNDIVPYEIQHEDTQEALTEEEIKLYFNKEAKDKILKEIY